MADPSQLMSLPQAAANSDPMTAIYLLVGAFVVKELLSLGRDFIKGLAARNVAREDEDKKALKESLGALQKKHEDRLDSLQKKYDDRFEELDDQINGFDKSISNMQGELKQVRDTLESIRGGISEVRLGLDQRFEKQAQFYRDATREYTGGVEKKLEELEYKLRQDMTRAVADNLRTRRK